MLPAVPSVSATDVPPDAVVLDVREDDEWAAGHIDRAHHIPMGELPGRFADVANLAGGMGAWASAGRPMVSETGGAPFVR